MPSIVPPERPAQLSPRPAICPVCGLMADNGIPRRSELTTMAVYVCTEGHLWSVTWVEAA